MVRYKVHLRNQNIVTLEAAKINTGERRLWFFDADDNLTAVFQWENIAGFSVEGSAAGQIITDRVPLDMGKIAPEELSESTRLYLDEIRSRREKLKNG